MNSFIIMHYFILFGIFTVISFILSFCITVWFGFTDSAINIIADYMEYRKNNKLLLISAQVVILLQLVIFSGIYLGNISAAVINNRK